MNYLPSNISASKDDLKKAREILATQDNYDVRYIRDKATVGLALLPPRDEEGKIIDNPDIPWKRKPVICKGMPLACVIAFVGDDDKLRVGWSKRNPEKKLIKTQDLNYLYDSILENSTIDGRVVRSSDKTYGSCFNNFCSSILNVLAYNPTKDLEISFSKDAGRTSAILRGMLDEITIYKRFVKSKASGAVPNDVARMLRWFVPFIEAKHGMKAVNVKVETEGSSLEA